jgi:biopolymer transport protein ExbB/TolQ
MRFFMQMGVFGYPMVILSIVVVTLAVKKAVDLFGGRELTPAQMENGLHAILFWGAVTAVFGVLGQITGIYNALNVMARAKEISPQVTAMGFAESFTTTLYGFTALLVSAILWFVLFDRYRKIRASK